MNPLDLIAAHHWQRAVFTTYALSLSFFEAVILDSLVRGRSRGATILSDVEGVRMSLSEKGAQRVGKDYELEPIALNSGGVFHPKLTVLIGDEGPHVLVGSGNLTFNGWGGNLEAVEHLHPGIAASAIRDIGDFFELLDGNEKLSHEAGHLCRDIADELRQSAPASGSPGNIRFLHNLSGPIASQFVEIAEELGGAERLTVASPFWDGGTAIDQLCRSLDLDKVHIHAHLGGTVRGTNSSNWPEKANTSVEPVRIELLEEEKPRRLHAKLFEIVCRNGRVVFSGSANATSAALNDGNVEACIARIYRERQPFWDLTDAVVPEIEATLDEEESDNANESGVVWASLRDGQVHGRVLTPSMQGRVTVSQLKAQGPQLIGEAELDANTRFSVEAPDLEKEAFGMGRIVIEVRGETGTKAQGFVTVTAFSDIQRRSGLAARSLTALIAGTETPEDVAAIMSWFHENPDRLTGKTEIGGGKGDDSGDEETEDDRTVRLDELDPHHPANINQGFNRSAGAGAAWRRFMDQIFSALRDQRGSLSGTSSGQLSGDDDERGVVTASQTQTERDAQTNENSLATFEALFRKLLEPDSDPDFKLMAFDLTHFVCDRLEPDMTQVERWLSQLLPALVRTEIPEDRTTDVSSTIVIRLAKDAAYNDPKAARNARALLLHIDCPFNGPPPESDMARSFFDEPPGVSEIVAAWTSILEVRTGRELLNEAVAAFGTGEPPKSFEDLRELAKDEWTRLREAIMSQDSADRIIRVSSFVDACPEHYLALTPDESGRLKSLGVTKTSQCAGGHLILLEAH
jgi:hypothetical protein